MTNVVTGMDGACKLLPFVVFIVAQKLGFRQ